jgi:hypothetical protein
MKVGFNHADAPEEPTQSPPTNVSITSVQLVSSRGATPPDHDMVAGHVTALSPITYITAVSERPTAGVLENVKVRGVDALTLNTLDSAKSRTLVVLKLLRS